MLPRSQSNAAEPIAVTLIEGTPTSGTFLVTPVVVGESHCMLEIRVERGASSQMHAHSHESLVYVVSGRLRTVIGERVQELGQGEACCHAPGVMHSVEALEDTVYLETKVPVPDLGAVFRS